MIFSGGVPRNPGHTECATIPTGRKNRNSGELRYDTGCQESLPHPFQASSIVSGRTRGLALRARHGRKTVNGAFTSDKVERCDGLLVADVLSCLSARRGL